MLRQFAAVFSGDLVGKLLGAVLLFVLVRSLQPTDFANYVYLWALAILAITLASGHFNRAYIAAGEHAPPPRTACRQQIATALVALGAALLISAQGEPWFLLLCVATYTVTASAYEFGRTHEQKHQRFRRWAIVEAWRSAFALLLTLPMALLLQGNSLLCALFLAQSVACMGAFAWRLPTFPLSHQCNRPPVKGDLLRGRRALLMLAYSGLLAVWGQTPILLIKQWENVETLADFGSAFRYYGVVLGLSSAVNVVLLPNAARGEGALTGAARRMLWGVGALVVLAMLAGGWAIPWIDGGRYPHAVQTFRILCLGLIPGLAAAPFVVQALRDAEGMLLLALALGLAACVGVCWLLRPYGAPGYAWGLPAATAVYFVVLWAHRIKSGRTDTSALPRTTADERNADDSHP